MVWNSPRGILNLRLHLANLLPCINTSNGQLPGWDGRLGACIFYGDREAWDKYAHAKVILLLSLILQCRQLLALTITATEWMMYSL